MQTIKLVEKSTDISSLKMYKFDWDVEVNGKPYQVVAIEGYVHTIGGPKGLNDLWMYPRDSEPTYDNLVEFSAKGSGVSWGIRYDPSNYIRYKWGESECFSSGGAMITRNGKDFYFCSRGIKEAELIIESIEEHPISPQFFEFDEKVLGRKVYWRSEPGIVTYYCQGQACVIIAPDTELIDKFTVPAEFADEDPNYYEEGYVKAEIFSEHIWWFRD